MSETGVTKIELSRIEEREEHAHALTHGFGFIASLIGVVLLQTGKRADLAGAFGGGGSQTAFGARGAATILSKLTTTFAVIFMLTSIGLSIVAAQQASSQGRSVLDEVAAPATTPSEIPPADTSGGAVVPDPDAVSNDEEPIEESTSDPEDDATE